MHSIRHTTVRKAGSRLVLGLAMLIAATSTAVGQTIPDLSPGERIRLTTRERPPRKVVADYGGVMGGALRLESAGREWARIPIADIERIEVMHGRRSNVWRGARTGALVGVGLGLILGVAGTAGQDSDNVVMSDDGALVGSVVLLGALGMGTGALIGGLMPSIEWEQVFPDPTATRPVGPGNLRLGIGLKLPI